MNDGGKQGKNPLGIEKGFGRASSNPSHCRGSELNRKWIFVQLFHFFARVTSRPPLPRDLLVIPRCALQPVIRALHKSPYLRKSLLCTHSVSLFFPQRHFRLLGMLFVCYDNISPLFSSSKSKIGIGRHRIGERGKTAHFHSTVRQRQRFRLVW